MSLHEQLLACVDITTDQDATSRVIYFIIFEDEIWVVEGSEGEGAGEFKEGLGGEDSHGWF